VAAEMAAMAPGTVQLHNFSQNKKITKYAKDEQPEKAMRLFQQMQ
jgi:pentatricopeptide repeat protein